ncbi:MAG: MAPEG family protein [Pseudomonadota bacterium]
MPIELTLLGSASLLILIQIVVAAAPKTFSYGPSYSLGTQDEQKPPPTVFANRALRASRNGLETFPLFAAAVLGVVLAGKTGGIAEVGAWMYLIGRLIYWPAYVFAVPYLRSIIWTTAIVGIVMIVLRMLFG